MTPSWFWFSLFICACIYSVTQAWEARDQHRRIADLELGNRNANQRADDADKRATLAERQLAEERKFYVELVESRTDMVARTEPPIVVYQN